VLSSSTTPKLTPIFSKPSEGPLRLMSLLASSRLYASPLSLRLRSRFQDTVAYSTLPCFHPRTLQAYKFFIVVELLMGNIPDRSTFRLPVLKKALIPYFQIVQGSYRSSLPFARSCQIPEISPANASILPLLSLLIGYSRPNR
jgi:hypothetical protein